MVCKHICLFTTLGETLARPFFLAHMHRHTSPERLSEGFKMEEESESPCPVPACLSPGPIPVSPRLRWGCSVLGVSPRGPWEPERGCGD